jgi:hypothetical protein
MPDRDLIMHVEENRRASDEGDDWQVWVQGRNDGSHASVRSWTEARQRAADNDWRLAPPSSELERQMRHAGVDPAAFDG